jgi:hypothetical protein
MNRMFKNINGGVSNTNGLHDKEPFFMFKQTGAVNNTFFGKNEAANITHTDGPPDVQKEDEDKKPKQATPCPASVSIGKLAQFNHSSLSAADQDTWGTYLGVTSLMNVGPGPDHSGHCMKEKLTTVSNDCPKQVYSRGATPSQPCAGDKCLDINTGHTSGDAATHSSVTDGPTSFIDLHRTINHNSLLEGSGANSCTVVCEQVYSCDRTQATTGKFTITRNYQAGTHTKKDGTSMHITTGSVKKALVP